MSSLRVGKVWLTLFSAFLIAGGVFAQEDFDLELEKLADKLSSEGPAGKLADLMRSDAGRVIVKQRIAELAAKDLERIQQDPLKSYVGYLFTEDADGKLHLRPERRVHMWLVWGDARTWDLAWEEFSAGCRAVARRISADREIDRRMKAYWENEAFQWARFSGLEMNVAPWQERPSPEAMFHAFFTSHLRRGGDGKLRVQALERHRHGINSMINLAEAARDTRLPKFEESHQRLLTLLGEPDRKLASTPAARGILCVRWRTLGGGEDALSKLLAAYFVGSPEAGYRFKPDSELLKDIGVVEVMAQTLTPLFEKSSGETADGYEIGKRLKRILSEEPCIFAILSYMLEYRWVRSREARMKAVLQLREDLLVSGGEGRFKVRPGRFVDESGRDSVQALGAECDKLGAEAPLTKPDFKGLSRRMADPRLQWLYGSRAGVRTLEGFQQGKGSYGGYFHGTIGDIKANARNQGLARFLEEYTVREGERYALRPGRAGEVEEMFEGGEKLRKALEGKGAEGASGGGQKP